MAEKKEKKIFNQGNPEVVRFITTVNSYMYAAFFLIIGIVMLINKAWLSFLILMVLVAINLPQAKEILARRHIKGLIKLFLCFLLIYLAIISTGFYV
jgi:hypothetical protein